MQIYEKPPHNPRARMEASQRMSAGEQINRFGFALERMNEQAARDRRRGRRRMVLVVLTMVAALLLGYTLREPTAKIAHTITRAEVCR